MSEERMGYDSVTKDSRSEQVEGLCDLLRAELEAGRQTLDSGLLLPEVDLRTLLSEMTAIKAEVRAETTAARELRDQLTGTVETLRRELERAGQRETTLRDDTERLGKQETRRAALDLVDLADRLEPAVERAQELARPRWHWFTKRPDPAAVSLYEGLVLSQQRLTRKLTERGFSRVATVGQPFDPRTMEAVEIVANS